MGADVGQGVESPADVEQSDRRFPTLTSAACPGGRSATESTGTNSDIRLLGATPIRQSIPGPAGIRRWRPGPARAAPAPRRPPPVGRPDRQPEVVGRAEEAAGHDRRLVALPQQRRRATRRSPFSSRGNAIIPPSTGAQSSSGRAARKRSASSLLASRMRAGARGERSRRSSATTLSRSAGVRRDDAEEVVEPPHPPRELGLGQRSSRSAGRQAVDLGEAARDHELAAEARPPSATAGRAPNRPRGTPRPPARARPRRARASPIAGSRSSGGVKALDGIVEVGDHDEPGPGRERPLHVARDRGGSRLGAPREAAHLGRSQRAASDSERRRSAPRSAPRRRARRARRARGRLAIDVPVAATTRSALDAGLARQALQQRRVAVEARRR